MQEGIVRTKLLIMPTVVDIGVCEIIGNLGNSPLEDFNFREVLINEESQEHSGKDMKNIRVASVFDRKVTELLNCQQVVQLSYLDIVCVFLLVLTINLQEVLSLPRLEILFLGQDCSINLLALLIIFSVPIVTKKAKD